MGIALLTLNKARHTVERRLRFASSEIRNVYSPKAIGKIPIDNLISNKTKDTFSSSIIVHLLGQPLGMQALIIIKLSYNNHKKQ